MFSLLGPQLRISAQNGDFLPESAGEGLPVPALKPKWKHLLRVHTARAETPLFSAAAPSTGDKD